MAPTDAAGVRGSTRRDPRILIMVAGVLLAARIGTGLWTGRHAPAEPADLVTWQDAGAAHDASVRAGRPILYDFTAGWCPPCKRMKQEVFNDRRSADFINQRFIPVRILDRAQETGSNPPEIQALQKRYAVDAFPTLVIVASDGRVLKTQRGYAGSEGTRFFLESAVKAKGTQGPR